MQVAVTYMWLGSPLLELVEILCENFEPDMLVWLDIVFNDQRSPEAVSKVRPGGCVMNTLSIFAAANIVGRCVSAYQLP